MKLNCILLRSGGTHIDLDGVEYHFATDKDGNHSCDVTDKQHLKILLAIPEAYEIADDVVAKEDKEDVADKKPRKVKVE